ncbi:mCG144761, partial [Mus musculus]
PHELLETVAACTRPVQVQARWGSSTERGIGHGRLLLTKKLSATDTDLQRKIVFSNEVPLSILTILQGMWSLTVKLT